MMNCPHCNNTLPNEARFCDLCGNPVTKFAPPDGFEIDPVSLLFYRSDPGSDPNTGAPVRWVTWFDPNTGEYQQVSYPVEAQPEPDHQEEPVQIPQDEPIPEHQNEPVEESAPESATALEPEPVPTPLEEPANQTTPKPGPQIPEGFTYDPSSGLYYITTPGTDPATGAAGNWYTWFYPSTEEYRQQFYPAAPALSNPREPDRQKGPKPVGHPPIMTGPDGKGKMRPLLILLPLIALLGGSGLAFWQAGGLSLFSQPAPLEIPEGIVITSPDSANVPVFLPINDADTLPDSDADMPIGPDATPAAPEESATPETLALNTELLSLLGKTNAELKAINGAACKNSYVMYGDDMIANYSDMPVTYPVAFHFFGEEYEKIAEILEKESVGTGNPVEGRNIWGDQLTIANIEAGGKGLNTVFKATAPITFGEMNNSFTMDGELNHIMAEEESEWAHEFDTWECVYLAGEYRIFATFYEPDGERVLLSAVVWTGN